MFAIQPVIHGGCLPVLFCACTFFNASQASFKSCQWLEFSVNGFLYIFDSLKEIELNVSNKLSISWMKLAVLMALEGSILWAINVIIPELTEWLKIWEARHTRMGENGGNCTWIS